MPSKCDTPMKSAYRPELDDTAELKAEGVQYYQELVGVLRWAVELGRVDILYEVATMLPHLAMPRIGHLEEILHIFGYLKQRPKRKLAFDPDHPMIDERQFNRTTFTGMKRRLFHGTCLHQQEAMQQRRIVSTMRIWLATM